MFYHLPAIIGIPMFLSLPVMVGFAITGPITWGDRFRIIAFAPFSAAFAGVLILIGLGDWGDLGVYMPPTDVFLEWTVGTGAVLGIVARVLLRGRMLDSGMGSTRLAAYAAFRLGLRF